MKRSRIIVTVLSVFCILLIGITSFNSGFLAPLRNGAGIFLVPMERGVNALGGGIYHHAHDLAELRRVQEENRRLTERVGALTEENTRLSSEVYELARLRELYELDQEYLQYPKVAARVIARDSGNWFRIFRIDKGTKDGIRPDMNVLVNGGLIGIVTDVGLNYATVRTIIDDSSNVSTYGCLYNWAAVMNGNSASSAVPSNVQGVCPTGWHVPSAAEWIVMQDYVGAQNDCQCGHRSDLIAKALSSTTAWESSTIYCSPGYLPMYNNASGFSALPAGYYYGGGYSVLGREAWFWSTTEVGVNGAAYRNIQNDLANFQEVGISNYFGLSVRCLKD